MIQFACACGKVLRAPPAAAGKKGVCPQCKATIVVPGGVAVSRPPAQQGPNAARTPAASAERASSTSRAPQTAAVPSPAAASRSTADAAANRSNAATPPATAGSLRSLGIGGITPRRAREYLYIGLLLALAPLALSVVMPAPTERDEIIATVREHPEIAEQSDKIKSDSDFFRLIPDHRLHGAFLEYGSQLHWVFAVLSATVFFAAVISLFPKTLPNPWVLLGGGLFTATMGVLVLLTIQFAASMAAVGGAVGLVLMLIALSYHYAEDPTGNFALSLLGFTFGVGLCEEFCKAIPVIIFLKHEDSSRKGKGINNWRVACLWGLTSGVGFGVAEAIIYGYSYSGKVGATIYAVRFLSCVALHAIWSASAGITLFNRQAALEQAERWYEILIQIVISISIAMLLHGLYDTCLKKEMNAFALVTAIASFAWLAVQIETMRRMDAVIDSPKVSLAARYAMAGRDDS